MGEYVIDKELKDEISSKMLDFIQNLPLQVRVPNRFNIRKLSPCDWLMEKILDFYNTHIFVALKFRPKDIVEFLSRVPNRAGYRTF